MSVSPYYSFFLHREGDKDLSVSMTHEKAKNILDYLSFYLDIFSVLSVRLRVLFKMNTNEVMKWRNIPPVRHMNDLTLLIFFK
jgi:hypothetical protein